MTAENFCYWLQGFIELTEKRLVLIPSAYHAGAVRGN
jgi:hypothetical protein